MKKVIIIASVLIAVLLCFCGCTSKFLFVMASGQTTGTSISQTYQKFTGQYEKTFNLSGGDRYNIDFECTTESGNLAVKVTQSDETVLYDGDVTHKSKFTVHVDGSGKVSVMFLSGSEGHSGSFKATWVTE